MLLFSRNRDIAVRSFILKLVNNNCAEVDALIEGPRAEGRVDLVMVVMVVPVERGKLLIEKAFAAVTKEFSTAGMALVLDEPMGLDEVVLGFRWEGDVTWVRAKAKHVSPMGGGFCQIGFRLTEIVHAGDHPDLGTLAF